MGTNTNPNMHSRMRAWRHDGGAAQEEAARLRETAMCTSVMTSIKDAHLVRNRNRVQEIDQVHAANLKIIDAIVASIINEDSDK